MPANEIHAATKASGTLKPDIKTDSFSRRLYANDASMYEEMPTGVFFPENEKDIVALVRWCAETNTPITARAAGTSLAGQTTGGGVVMDTSRKMHHILSLDPKAQKAVVQPGVIRDTLNREGAKVGLQFGPDTSTTNRCMLGGMIGNNSAGSFSLKHRTTREHTISIKTVLSDGSLATFGPVSNEELEAKKLLQTFEGHIYREITALVEAHKGSIIAAYPHPEIIRRNTGYALDRLCEMSPFTPGGRAFNLAELLCGSEGTLAMTVESVVNLVPVPKQKVLLIGQYATLNESMLATVDAVKFGPAAVELVDDIIIEATKLNIEQSRNRFFLVGEPKAVLMIQFEGDSLEEITAQADKLAKYLSNAKLGYDYRILTDANEMNRVWELRKAGLGLLMGTWAESRTPEFIEDTSVRVEDLPQYIIEFEALMKRYDTHSVYYAHASVGELHLRPELNLTTRDGLEKMKRMAVDVAKLVKKYRGSLSGEHGDGRVRAPYISLVLGEEMMPLLRQVKQIWDPKGLFNPGKIVDAKPMDSDLRFYPEDEVPQIDTIYNYRVEGNFMALVDKCNGAGVCRKLADSGGTMCPSYMATRDEQDSTRGRANLFRQLFRGERAEAFASADLKKGLDLCLSCKACKSECPANVDMAKMKAEFTQGYFDKNGAPLSAHFFARPELLYPLASPFAPIVNVLNRTRFAKEIFKTLFNVHPERNLPDFAKVPFEKWFAKHRKSISNNDISSRPKVLIMVDMFMNYHEPSIGIAMVETLEALGYEVLATKPLQSGRTHLSKGFLRDAKKIAQRNIVELANYAKKGVPIVGQEPSEILTLRDEYLDLCDAPLLEDATTIASSSFMFEEFLLKHFEQNPQDLGLFEARGREVKVHGHCHAKALVGVEPVLELLSKVGYSPQNLNTGCCGMAGSFGYEANHYDISMEIGELKLFPQLRDADKDALICAHGFSCRHQISDGVALKSYHTAEIVRNCIKQ